MRKSYTLVYWPDNSGYVGKLREVPGIFSQGETVEELEANIREAFNLVCEGQKFPDSITKVKTKSIEL